MRTVSSFCRSWDEDSGPTSIHFEAQRSWRSQNERDKLFSSQVTLCHGNTAVTQRYLYVDVNSTYNPIFDISDFIISNINIVNIIRSHFDKIQVKEEGTQHQIKRVIKCGEFEYSRTQAERQNLFTTKTVAKTGQAEILLLSCCTFVY